MAFTEKEIMLLSDQSVFEMKREATEKLKLLMESVRLVLLERIEPKKLVAPSSTDFKRGQIAKGENYEGFPYVMLDFPKCFSKSDVFTYRTIFWYGHDLIFSVILAGEFLEHYRNQFKIHFDEFAKDELWISSSDVWNWKADGQVKIANEQRERIFRMMEELNYLKVMKRFPASVLNDEPLILREIARFYELTEKMVS
jgi:hypothetical protein